MYFPTSQHYSCTELNYLSIKLQHELMVTNDDDNKCIICLCDVNKKTAHRLEEHHFIYKKCSCNPIIHKECFMQWYNKKFQCPICLIHLELCESYEKRILNYTFRFGYFLGYCFVKLIYTSINFFFISFTLIFLTNILSHVIEKYI